MRTYQVYFLNVVTSLSQGLALQNLLLLFTSVNTGEFYRSAKQGRFFSGLNLVFMQFPDAESSLLRLMQNPERQQFVSG